MYLKEKGISVFVFSMVMTAMAMMTLNPAMAGEYGYDDDQVMRLKPVAFKLYMPSYSDSYEWSGQSMPFFMLSAQSIVPPAGEDEIEPPTYMSVFQVDRNGLVYMPLQAANIVPPAGEDEIEPPTYTLNIVPPAGEDEIEPPTYMSDYEYDRQGLVFIPVMAASIVPPAGEDEIEPPTSSYNIVPPAGEDEIEPPTYMSQYDINRQGLVFIPVMAASIVPPAGEDEIEPPTNSYNIVPPAGEDEIEPPTLQGQIIWIPVRINNPYQ